MNCDNCIYGKKIESIYSINLGNCIINMNGGSNIVCQNEDTDKIINLNADLESTCNKFKERKDEE